MVCDAGGWPVDCRGHFDWQWWYFTFGEFDRHIGWPLRLEHSGLDTLLIAANVLIGVLLAGAAGAIAHRFSQNFMRDRFGTLELLIVTGVCAVLLAARNLVFTRHFVYAAIVGTAATCLLAVLFAMIREAVNSQTGSPRCRSAVLLTMAVTFISLTLANCLLQHYYSVEFFDGHEIQSRGWPFAWTSTTARYDFHTGSARQQATNTDIKYLGWDILIVLATATSGVVAYRVAWCIQQRGFTIFDILGVCAMCGIVFAARGSVFNYHFLTSVALGSLATCVLALVVAMIREATGRAT